ncbi:MAG TPA: hypothetical protein VD970_06120 [Acetobacteraceae bacterium]|nr:hypothetical protein [Acetobacteraceae bacterium]
MGDAPEMIGSISIGVKDGQPTLIFNGPEVPGLPGVGTSMSLSYDSERRRVRVTAALEGEDSLEVELTNLPEEWRRLVQTPAGSRPRTVNLPTPDCAALMNSTGGFMTYNDYQQYVRMGRAPPPPPPGFGPARPFNPLDPAVMRRAAMAVIYPPLTRAVFDQLVSRCRGRQMFGR